MIAKLWNSNKKNMDKNGDEILQYVLLKGVNMSEIANQRTKFLENNQINVEVTPLEYTYKNIFK